MSNYTNTFVNNNGDTVLAAEMHTEFSAIKTAVATKGNKTYARDSAGTEIGSTFWMRDVATGLLASYGETVVTLTPIVMGGANQPLNINAALGNLFKVDVNWNNNAGSLLLNNPTNPIDGQLITLVVKNVGIAAPDGAILDNGTDIFSATNIFKGQAFGSTTGSTNRANLYQMLYTGGKWLCWIEQQQLVVT